MRAKENENNQGRKTLFLIVELGGKKIHNLLWTPNPWPVANCGNVACFPCRGDKGGDCRRQGVTYNLYCETCQGERNLRVKVASYPGETGRNMFERGKEHLALLQKQSEENSVLWLHSLHHHEGSTDVKYKMVCTGTYNTPLDRQMSEKIEISHFQGDILMNRKNELGGAVIEREKFKYRRWGAGGGK